MSILKLFFSLYFSVANAEVCQLSSEWVNLGRTCYPLYGYFGIKFGAVACDPNGDPLIVKRALICEPGTERTEASDINLGHVESKNLAAYTAIKSIQTCNLNGREYAISACVPEKSKSLADKAKDLRDRAQEAKDKISDLKNLKSKAEKLKNVKVPNASSASSSAGSAASGATSMLPSLPSAPSLPSTEAAKAGVKEAGKNVANQAQTKAADAAQGAKDAAAAAKNAVSNPKLPPTQLPAGQAPAIPPNSAPALPHAPGGVAP